MAGTYADEDPNAGIGERIANSLSKIVGLPTKSRREPITGTDSSSGESETATEASDDGKLGRMKQAQSSDRDNSYSY